MTSGPLFWIAYFTAIMLAFYGTVALTGDILLGALAGFVIVIVATLVATLDSRR